MQEYEKPNAVFTKSLKSMNFGKNAPWNVLKANDLFANKPKTQPIANQVQLQGSDFYLNIFLQKVSQRCHETRFDEHFLKVYVRANKTCNEIEIQKVT